jgi:hypothetical protein
MDLLRPSRSFALSVVAPSIYRKWLTGGDVIIGEDMSVTNGSPTVTALNGRFIHEGGLQEGNGITIAGVAYQVLNVPNDYTLTLASNYAGITATGVHYEYRQIQSRRDLYVLAEQGPAFDFRSDWDRVCSGYSEIVRFVAHDPFWRGRTQTQSWLFPDDFGDLVFDGNGAFFN